MDYMFLCAPELIFETIIFSVVIFGDATSRKLLQLNAVVGVGPLFNRVSVLIKRDIRELTFSHVQTS
jgi:hypothetical protein